MKTLIILLLISGTSFALDNGLARTPPMGWLTWARFVCNRDCVNYPDDCISEKLMKDHAWIMANEGYKEAGYDIVTVDDCWLASTRDPKTNKLRPDPDRFPSGMKALGDYIHSLGLKFGIYEDIGSNTCQGYPGLDGNYDLDAQTFAEWGADYLKIDGCHANDTVLNEGYPAFGKALNATGHPIIYSCEWSVYGGSKNFTEIADTCNLWRGGGDIKDSWSSITGTIENYSKNQDIWAPPAGPGAWNDPDQLEIGNFGLSYDQSKTQMAVWSILAAPLIMSTDLRTIEPRFKKLLLNEHVIAINQDPLGIQGRRIAKGTVSTFMRPVTPVIRGIKSGALAITNYSILGSPMKYSFKLSDFKMPAATYKVLDVFDDSKILYRNVNASQTLSVMVNPSGVALLKAVPIP